MAKKRYEESNISAIASAIRNKLGGSDTYKVSEMAAAIGTIPVGDGRCPRSEGVSLCTIFESDQISFIIDADGYSMPFTGEAYLESHGTEYINTNYIPNENTKIVMRCNIKPERSYPTIFGTRDSNDTNRFYLFARNNSYNNFIYGYGSTTTNLTNPYYNIGIIITFCKSYLSIVNELLNELRIDPSPSGSPTATSPLYLFNLCENSSPYNASVTGCTMKLYECSIYEGETLVHHYLPALGENDEACLYDTVSESYLYNSGSGTFTYVEAEE